MKQGEDLIVLQVISASILEIPTENLKDELKGMEEKVKKLESFIDRIIDLDGDLIRCSYKIRKELGLSENEIYRLLKRLEYI